MNRIYFDNAATTPLCEAAKEAMTAAMECFGNPSSVHETGAAAAKLLRDARRAVGEALGERFLRDGQLIFTGCGTEATALALLGTAHAKERRTAKTILTTDSEHPSVARNLDLLEKEGFRVVRVGTKGGVLDMDTVRANMNADLFMVSMMLVNNETGARYPVEEVFAAAHAASAACVCHCDAVQGFLKVPFRASSLGADLITVSAHKIHGPKGVGALYVKERMLKERRITAFLAGGGQEFGLRSGTENMIGIAGFAAAASYFAPRLATDTAHVAALSDRLIKALAGSECRVNRAPVSVPHIVSVTLPRIKSETMLHFLSREGIAVSAGSACSAHAAGPSGTLIAFGLPSTEADTTLRISLSSENTEAQIDALVAALERGISSLVRIKR